MTKLLFMLNYTTKSSHPVRIFGDNWSRLFQARCLYLSTIKHCQSMELVTAINKS